jgi:hypothetical protein
MRSSRADEIPGRVTVGLAVPLFLGAIMFDLANDSGVAAPSPLWVVPLFFVAGLVAGLLWPAPSSDESATSPSFARTVAIAGVGGALIGTLLHPSSEVFYWSCAVGTSVVVAIMTASVKSARSAGPADVAE